MSILALGRAVRAAKNGPLLAALVGVGSSPACASDETPAHEPGSGATGGSLPASGRGGTSSTGKSGAPATGGAPSAGNTSQSGGMPTSGGAGGSAGTGGATAGTGMAAGGIAAGGTAGGATTGGATAGGADAGGRGGAATAGRANVGGAEASGGNGAGAAGSPGGSSSAGTSGGGSMQSGGCGKTPTLKNSTSNSNPTPITLSVSGTNREYAVRFPSNYDSNHAYRLILDLHGYGGTYKETAGEDYFGLWTASNNTTIFIALSAISTDWRTGDNLAYVDAVLKAVEADLCIDTSRVMLEGFSQGAAQAWQLACSRPGVFRAVVGHSGGGVTNPTSCEPIPYLGSGGLQESVTQVTQTDQFAKWNGCTVTTLPTAPSGKHVCTNYTGCPTDAPVRWCNYDGPHTPLPTDSGMSSSWMPSETWPFFEQF